MLHLIQGSDIQKVLYRVDLLKKDGFKYFFGDFSTIRNAISSTSLFTKEFPKLIINLDTNQNISLNEESLHFFLSAKKRVDIVITGTSIKIPKKFEKAFDKKEVYDIADNKDIFKLLDGIFLKKEEDTLRSVQNFIKKGEEIYLISMVFYIVKNMLLFFYDEKSFIKLKPFVQSKTRALINKNFSKKTLKDVILALSEADYKVKTSSDSKSIIIGLLLFIMRRSN